MLNTFIIFSALCAIISGLCRLLILTKKNLTLTIILFFLAIACELRNPYTFSSINSADRARLLAHLFTLVTTAFMIQLAYLLYNTGSLLNKHKFLHLLYRLRWIILTINIATLITIYKSERHHITLIELAHSHYSRTYWLTLAITFGVSSIILLYTTYLFDPVPLNIQIQICIYCIRIFTFLNLYYCAVKIMTQFRPFSINFIEYSTVLSIGTGTFALALAGILPVLSIFRKKTLRYGQ